MLKCQLPPQPFGNGLYPAGLELERRLVGDQSGADGQDFRFHFQIVLFQGASCLHNVHDHIGEPQNRGDLNGSVKFNYINISADSPIVTGGNICEFGSDPERAAASFNRRAVTPAWGCRPLFYAGNGFHSQNQ